MKKVYKLFVLVMMINSCDTANYKRFTFYKDVPKIKESFLTNGVYYRFEEFHAENGDDRYWAHLFFFYRDGTFTTTALTMNGSSDNDITSKISSEFNAKMEKSKGTDGAYLITGDSLKTQMFIGTQQRTRYSLDIIEDVFLIKRENNSLKLISTLCQWCTKDEKKIHDAHIAGEEYKFLPLITKPDSSKIWFTKTKWYKDGIKSSKKEPEEVK